MACEVPVAASWAAPMPEVVNNAALLFNPYNIVSIAKALEEIITDNGLRKKLVTKGRERIKNFSYEKCAKETLAIITNL